MAKKEEKKVVEPVEEKKVETKKVSSNDTAKNAAVISGAIAMVVAAVVIIAIIVVVFILTKIVAKPSLEKQLNDSLSKMGKEFYTEFYYVEISKNKSTAEVSEFLERFSDVGIKIDLDNLSRHKDGKFKEEIAKFKNSDGKACNENSTRAVIYPKKPYGKNDYTIKTELDCGFEKSEK